MSRPVLVVDDEPSMRLLSRLLLQEHGLRCEEASSGDEALARCATGDGYAAVVLDHRMPGRTGLETAQALREAGDATPIVLYTGFAAPELEAAAGGLGIAVVSKSETEQMVGAVLELTGAAAA